MGAIVYIVGAVVAVVIIGAIIIGLISRNNGGNKPPGSPAKPCIPSESSERETFLDTATSETLIQEDPFDGTTSPSSEFSAIESEYSSPSYTESSLEILS